jgi:hypothetical protein
MAEPGSEAGGAGEDISADDWAAALAEQETSTPAPGDLAQPAAFPQLKSDA